MPGLYRFAPPGAPGFPVAWRGGYSSWEAWIVILGRRTETGLADASGAQAIRDIAWAPAGTWDRSNSAWPESGRTTGAWGFQPVASGRWIRATASTDVPGRTPLTVRTTRTGAVSSVRGSTAGSLAFTTSVLPTSSMSV